MKTLKVSALVLPFFVLPLVAGSTYPPRVTIEVLSEQYRTSLIWQSDLQNDGTGMSAPYLIATLASGTAPLAAGLPNHPQLMTPTSHASNANSGAIIRAVQLVGLSIAGYERHEFIFRPDRCTDVVGIYGFADTVTVASAPVDGIYLSRTGCVFTGRARSNSVDVDTADTYTVTSGTWYRLVVQVDSTAAGATFYIYSEGGIELWKRSVTSGVPVGVGRETAILDMVYLTSAGPAAALDTWDYVLTIIDRQLIR